MLFLHQRPPLSNPSALLALSALALPFLISSAPARVGPPRAKPTARGASESLFASLRLNQL